MWQTTHFLTISEYTRNNKFNKGLYASTQFEELLLELGLSCKEYIALRKESSTHALSADKEKEIFRKAMNLCQGPQWEKPLKTMVEDHNTNDI